MERSLSTLPHQQKYLRLSTERTKRVSDALKSLGLGKYAPPNANLPCTDEAVAMSIAFTDVQNFDAEGQLDEKMDVRPLPRILSKLDSSMRSTSMDRRREWMSTHYSGQPSSQTDPLCAFSQVRRIKSR